MEVAKEFIVFGTVQGTGFRAYSARIGRELHLKGTAENIDDGSVKVRCKGESKNVDVFIARIKELKLNTAEGASKINVEDVPVKKIKSLKPEQIEELTFKEKLGDLKVELAQGFQTGQLYIEKMRTDTMSRFDKMDKKYDIISKGMMDVVTVMNKRFESLEKKSLKSEQHIEKSNKHIDKSNEHIDKMLKVLMEKK